MVVIFCSYCKLYQICYTVLHLDFRQHFDLTSPSVGKCSGEVYSCPLCAKNFNSSPDLELHVNIEHRDILSPASPATYSCPVCGISLECDSNVRNTYFMKQIHSIVIDIQFSLQKYLR